MSESVTTIEIVVSRVITENGQMAFRMKLPETFSCIEVLGLLEAAKGWIHEEMLRRRDG